MRNKRMNEVLNLCQRYAVVVSLKLPVMSTFIVSSSTHC